MKGCLDTVSGTSMTDVTWVLDVLTSCHQQAAVHTQTGYQQSVITGNYCLCFLHCSMAG